MIAGNVSINDVKQISRLSKMSIQILRKKNAELDRAYTGKELTKFQLIYQIVFHRDAPNE